MQRIILPLAFVFLYTMLGVYLNGWLESYKQSVFESCPAAIMECPK